MRRSTSVRAAAVTVIAVAVLSGGIGASVTNAYLSSTETGSETVSAAESFGSSEPPGDSVAWDDADGDGRYDEGEETYSQSDFAGTGGENIDLSGKNIESTEPVTVEVNGNGDIDMSGARINAAGSIELTIKGGKSTLDLTDATLIAEDSITITASGGTIVLDSTSCDPMAIINGDTQGESGCD